MWGKRVLQKPLNLVRSRAGLEVSFDRGEGGRKGRIDTHDQQTFHPAGRKKGTSIRLRGVHFGKISPLPNESAIHERLGVDDSTLLRGKTGYWKIMVRFRSLSNPAGLSRGA